MPIAANKGLISGPIVCGVLCESVVKKELATARQRFLKSFVNKIYGFYKGLLVRIIRSKEENRLSWK